MFCIKIKSRIIVRKRGQRSIVEHNIGLEMHWLLETVAYVFTDIPFLDSHNLYFFIKNDLKFLKERPLVVITKYGRAKAQSWP